MRFAMQHWIAVFVMLFIGYWLGERFGGKLRGIPGIGQYT